LALGFGEMLLKMGVLTTMLATIRGALISPFRLIGTTLASCLLTNILTASQYVTIILPGEALSPAYRDMKISARVLSRTLEDGGTVFAFIVPWSMAAVNCSIIMGIPDVFYFPYAFFCFLCPIIALIYAATGFAIFRDEE
jgi:NhaC family Na+:H+ antiporter